MQNLYFILLLLFCFPVSAETPEEINDRVNEAFWGTRNACYPNVIIKKIEFEIAGYTPAHVVKIDTMPRYKHDDQYYHYLLEYKGMCYDDLQGVTIGINPCSDVFRSYPLVRVENK